MNLSKMKFALVSAMIIGVFSLNFTNPSAMSNNEFDAIGVANETSISTTPIQADAAIIPTTIVSFIQSSVTLMAHLDIGSKEMVGTTDPNVFDGAAKVNTSDIKMNKLD